MTKLITHYMIIVVVVPSCAIAQAAQDGMAKPELVRFAGSSKVYRIYKGKLSPHVRSPGETIRAGDDVLSAVTEANITHLEDSHFNFLTRMPRLTILIAQSVGLTSRGYRQLSQCKRLVYLRISGDGKLNVVDIDSVSRLVNLRTLILRSTDLRCSCLEKLRALEKLEHLEISGADVCSVGIKNLKGMTSLKGLSLGTPVTMPRRLVKYSEKQVREFNASLAELHQCSSLRVLNLGRSPLDDTGLKALVPLPLERLILGPNVTEHGVRELQRCRTLRVVIITNDHITNQTVDSLRRLMPKTGIWKKVVVGPRPLQ